jgi:hypothetical protein
LNNGKHVRIDSEWTTYVTAVSQYIVRTPEQFDPDYVCTLNYEMSVGDKPPIPQSGETAGDSQLRSLKQLLKRFI